MTNIFFHVFTRRYILCALLLVIVFFVSSRNIRAKNIHIEEFGSRMLLFKLIPHEELDSVIEEEIDFDTEEVVDNYWTHGNLVPETTPLTREVPESQEERPSIITQGGTALVKPDIFSEETKQPKEIQTYIVQVGDTLSTIAQRFHISINTLLWETNLTAKSLLRIGQKLVILPVNGVSHVVKRGETISSIAKKYLVDTQTIIDFNQLEPDGTISIGQKLIIPGGKKISIAPNQPSRFREQRVPQDRFLARGTGKYIWPTVCRRITTYFSWKHPGIDIACGMGKPIYAVKDGIVIRAATGWNGGYGNVIVIDHGDGTKSLYGHNSKMYVGVGETVQQGQLISAMGSTGRSTGPHVHFEIRTDSGRKNPFAYVK